jgi:hypothetical protein
MMLATLSAIDAAIGVKWQDILSGCCEIAGTKPFSGAHGMPTSMVQETEKVNQ